MIPGTGRGEDVAAPKRRVNCASLYKHSERFVAEVARNLLGPAVMLEAGVWRIVLVAVSRALALR